MMKNHFAYRFEKEADSLIKKDKFTEKKLKIPWN